MKRRLKVLIVDDNEVDRLAVRRALSKSPQPVEITERIDQTSALELLKEQTFDCAVVDYLLPDGNGASLVKEAKDLCKNPPPFVVLTGEKDREVDLAVMAAGAAEYLEKDHLTPSLLDRAIRYAIQNHQLLAQMQAANEKLREMDLLKSEFVSTASHELRTPLTIIREFVSLVRDGVVGPISDEQGDCLDSALNNCDRLGAIINDLLDLQRIESGKLQLKRTRVDLVSMIQRCYQDFQPRCIKENLDLNLDLEEALPAALCDEDKIAQVLVNLVGNAVKFTQATGRIVLRAFKRGAEAIIEVEDSGQGISLKDQEKIFDKFTQIQRKAGPGIKGTGLGLSITKRIVEMHDGTISVASEEKKGSRFTVTLPIYDESRELAALVNDKLSLTEAEEKAWTVIQLRSPVNRGAEEETRIWMTQAESALRRMIRNEEDDLVKAEGLGVLLVMVQTDKSGGYLLLERLAEELKNQGDTGAGLQYALQQVGQNNKETACRDLQDYEYRELVEEYQKT